MGDSRHAQCEMQNSAVVHWSALWSMRHVENFRSQQTKISEILSAQSPLPHMSGMFFAPNLSSSWTPTKFAIGIAHRQCCNEALASWQSRNCDWQFPEVTNMANIILHFKYHIISYHIISHHIISYRLTWYSRFRTPSYVANYATPVSVSKKNKRGTGWHPHDPKAIQQHEEGRQCKGVPPRGVTRSNRSQVITNQTFKKSIPNDFDCVLLELDLQVENSSSVNPF